MARPRPIRDFFKFCTRLLCKVRRTRSPLTRCMSYSSAGVALLTAVPCVSGTVREVCARIALGAPMSSIYGASAKALENAPAHYFCVVLTTPHIGTVFDVISTENPINIAYSNIALDLHQDLPYYESPPGVQLLHCLKFGATVSGAPSFIRIPRLRFLSTAQPAPHSPAVSPRHPLLIPGPHAGAGGETFLADAFAVARRLRDFDPALLHALARQPVTFSKVHFERQYPASLQYRRPVIVLNQDRAVPGTPASQPEIVSVNWSPQFEAPLHIDPNEAALFYEAYRCSQAMNTALSAGLSSMNHLTFSLVKFRLMSQFMSEAPQLKLRLNEVCAAAALQRSQLASPSLILPHSITVLSCAAMSDVCFRFRAKF
jgi:hypothetical protein